MKTLRHIITFSLILIITCTAFAQNAQDMMGQYKAMSDGTEKNFPKELEALMPKEFKIETRGFVYKETANMFLLVTLKGSRANDVYKKFGHTAEIEIGIMSYNPKTASYMSAQMPVVLEESKKGYAGGEADSNFEYSPVKASKINGADVYIQKGVRKNVELDNFKHEDQVYYSARAIMLKQNSMLTIRLIYYPLRGENVSAAVNQITKIFLATDFNRYMK